MDHLDDDMEAALAALPREHVGSAALEERVVRALHDARFFQAPNASVSPQLARRRRTWTAFAAFAASLAIFASGILVGRRTAHAEEAIALHVQAQEAAHRALMDSSQLAHEVQRAGSEYVSLLERLPSRSPDSGAPASRAVLLGREAARSTLHAAARQLARVSPNDPVAVLLVEGLRTDTRGQVLWF